MAGLRSLYQKGDVPSNWDTCPLGRICRQLGIQVSIASAARAIGCAQDLVVEYIIGFDGLANNDLSYNYSIGYQIGNRDRVLYERDKLKT